MSVWSVVLFVMLAFAALLVFSALLAFTALFMMLMTFFEFLVMVSSFTIFEFLFYLGAAFFVIVSNSLEIFIPASALSIEFSH